MTGRLSLHSVSTSTLQIAYERWGSATGWPIVLCHGFPYDVHCYHRVADVLAAAGADVVVPYLRGYGPTRFLDTRAWRSGQQAALAHDLHELITATGLQRPLVAGFDWGGRAACLTALLWPASVSGLVTVGGYNVQDIAAMATVPDPPDAESRMWYQWYFHSERGRAGLTRYRRELARQLWTEWSPHWAFTDEDFQAAAGSFDNPDFVDVVIHSYRHRYGLAPGDPAYQASEDIIAATPPITVPTIVLDATLDSIEAPHPRAEHEVHFSALVDHRMIATGHNAPQEDPAAFADTLLALRAAIS